MGCLKISYQSKITVIDEKQIFVDFGYEKNARTKNNCSNYYSGGMQIPGRNASTTNYRYSYQKQERDNRVQGEGNIINYKYRMYNPRLSRFFAVDPLAMQFPFYSPYHFSGNKPIAHIELEGLEDIYYGESLTKDGSAMLLVHNATELNNDLDNAFKNTDPNKYNGKVNVGWDLLIIKSTEGISSGGTYALSKAEMKNNILDIDFFENPYKQLDKYIPLIAKISNDPEKKGLIVIEVKDFGNDYAKEGNWAPAGESSITLSHEKRAHAIPYSNETNQSEEKEHSVYHYDPNASWQWGEQHASPPTGYIREFWPASLAGMDVKATDKTVKSFTNAKFKFLPKATRISAKPINPSKYTESKNVVSLGNKNN